MGPRRWIEASSVLALVAGVVSGCGPSLNDDDDPGDGPNGSAEASTTLACSQTKKVDLLFVVDDSVSMGQFRDTWSANLPGFIHVLEQEDVDADYRIAVIPTSVPGAGCASTPDLDPSLSSCRARLDDLVSDAGDGVEGFDLRPFCEERCDAMNLVFDPVDVGEETRLVPWLQRFGGVPNIVNTSTDDALTCAGQLSAAGCEVERPLDAMRSFLERSFTVGDPAFGFLRDDAIFMAVFVGDEDDQSEAPIEAYVDFLQLIEDRKREVPSPGSADQEVLVSVLAGVPQNYESGLVQIPDNPDGIGCMNSDGTTASVPHRLLAFAEAFDVNQDGTRNAYSICVDDYTPVLGPTANVLRDQIRPGCFEHCALLDDPTAERPQPTCRVIQTEADGSQRDLPECIDDQLPDGATACYITRTGDTLDPLCRADGLNLEFQVVRDPTAPAPDGTCVRATCRVSPDPAVDCPDL